MILSILENNRVNPAQNHTSTRIFVISNSRIFQNVKGLVMNFMNPSKNVLDILSTPIKHATKKKHHNIPMQQGFCEPCGQICEENIQQLHNEGVNHLHRIPLSATWHLPFTQTKTSLPGRTGGHHSCGTRGGGPSRRTP